MSDTASSTHLHLDRVGWNTRLETAVESAAILMPAHFSAPHAFRVEAKGNGFQVVDAV